MKKIYFISLMMFFMESCAQNKKTTEKAFEVFNEGVSLSLDANDAASKDDYERASQLNKKAIEKFKMTMSIDSTHSGAVSALAHSLYIEKDYKTAIQYFEKATKMQPDFAVNYQEMGLCKINLGAVEEGKKDIVKAFTLDKSEELKDITILDVQDIAKLAFDYGEGYIEQGEKEKGQDYKRFSIGVLLTAFDFDKTKKESAKLVSEYAARFGDKALVEKFRSIAK